MKRNSRFRSVLALAVVASFALTACSSSGTTPSPSNPTSSETQAADGNATLKFGSVFPSSSLDPTLARSNSDIAYLNPIYDRLLQLDGDLSIQPMLAESFEWTEDRTALRLILRAGVTFHDGSPFNAEVVKQNIEYKQKNGSPIVLAAVGSIESVEVENDTTVLLHIAEGRGADLLLALAETGGYMVSPTGLESGKLSTDPAGSGPYILDEVSEGQLVSYTKADSYWDDEQDSRPAEIEASIFTDATTLVNAFQSKQLDSIVTEDNARSQGLSTTPGVHSFVAEGFGHYKVQLNHGSEKLKDVKVRQAIAFAIDRAAVSLGAFDGTCDPIDQIAVKGSPAYDASLENFYTHDVAKAKSLLTEAGYPDGIELTGLYVSAPPFNTLAEIVQGMLKEAGINVSLRTTTIAASTADWAEGKTDITFLGGGLMINDALGIESLMRNIEHATVPNGSTEAVEAAAKGLLDSAFTEAEHAAILKATNKAITEDAASILLCGFNRTVLAQESVMNYTDVPNVFRGGPDFINMRITAE